MLQTDRIHDAAYGEAGPAVPKPDSVSEMFEFIIGFVRRRLVIILFALVLVTALGEVLVIKILPAKFAATATSSSILASTKCSNTLQWLATRPSIKRRSKASSRS